MTRPATIHTLRMTAPRCADKLRVVFLELADTLERHERLDFALAHRAGPIGALLLQVQEREPGEEG